MSDRLHGWKGRTPLAFPAWICFVAAWVCLPAAAWSQEEEEEETLRPGLTATYSVGGQPLCVRKESTPTVWLEPTQSPDPRVPVDGWAAEWTGTLQVLRRGSHRFWAKAGGKFEVLLDGKPLPFAAGGATPEFESGPVELKFGFHPLTVRFTPNPGAKTLKIEWQGDLFAREPLTARVVGSLGKQTPPADRFAEGQLALEERSCAACHQPSGAFAGVEKRPGPLLSPVKSMLYAGWIYHWLDDPHAFRPEAVMPRMFSKDRRGEIERYAVAATLGKTEFPESPKVDAKKHKEQARAGANIFVQTGCASCHQSFKDRPAAATLQHLDAKKPHAALASFIQNPGATDPGGRMPHFQLKKDEVEKLAAYAALSKPSPEGAYALPPAPRPDEVRALVLGDKATAEQAAEFAGKPLNEQLAVLGRQVMEARRCANCHAVELSKDDKLKSQWVKSDLLKVALGADGGCLAASAAAAQGKPPATGAELPIYGGNFDVGAVQTFLKTKTASTLKQAPAYQTALHVQRLRCTSCHERDGGGGIAPELIELLTKGQAEHAAESIKPPTLTGVAAKLQAAALVGVLEEDKRARPWMSMQMPRFKKEYMQVVPSGIASQDGDPLVKERAKSPKNSELVEAGRVLIGSKGFGCIKCHDLMGVSSGGVRGPDLSRAPERINPNWYHRWMLDPQRIEPGTRMPTVFLGGKSPYPEILGGDPQKQRDALWQYFAYARSLPAPEGLVAPGSTQQLAQSGDDAFVVRTFLPNVTARSMGVRFPNAVHAVFDGQACRLAYAWTGDFLDMGPVWNGRGGMKAEVKGALFWNAPGGFPWDVTTSSETAPDLSGREKDTNYGAITPQDGNSEKTFPSKLQFHGYRMVPAAKGSSPNGHAGLVPQFRFDLNLSDDGAEEASFTEELQTFARPDGTALSRRFKIAAPNGKTVWLLAATTGKAPQGWSADGAEKKLDAAVSTLPASAVLEVEDQGKPLVLQVREASEGCEWVVAKRGDAYDVFVRWKSVAGPAAGSLVLARPDEGRPGAAEALRAAALRGE